MSGVQGSSVRGAKHQRMKPEHRCLLIASTSFSCCAVWAFVCVYKFDGIAKGFSPQHHTVMQICKGNASQSIFER